MPVSAALPELESVATNAAAVVPVVVLGKGSTGGVSDAMGAGGCVPVPVSVTVCGEPVALSASENVAEKLVAEAGVKVTLKVQL